MSQGNDSVRFIKEGGGATKRTLYVLKRERYERNKRGGGGELLAGACFSISVTWDRSLRGG